MLKKLRAALGLDIKAREYAYGSDPEHGYLSAQKIPEKWVKTTCGYCSVGCGMVVGARDERIVSVRGDQDHPVNRGTLCPKGLSEHQMMASPHRARTPLLRQDGGSLERVSWEQAYGAMVARVRKVQERYGLESFAVLSTGQLVTEEFYALGKLVQLGFRTANYDGNTTLCMSSAVAGYKQSFGSDGPPGSYLGLQKAEVVFLIGANIADNHPVLWHHLNQNQNRTLIVCDPRKTKTAMLADIYLPIRPRGDIDLLNGLIHLVIENGYARREFIEAHTRGFAELEKHCRPYTLELVVQRTGLPPQLIWDTFQAIARAEKVFFAWTMGINHSTQGTDAVSLINTLALITGNIGRTGAAPMSITGQCNAMGSREFSFTSSMPGYRKFDGEQDRQELARLWGIDAQQLPPRRGLVYPDIVDGILEGKIRALWVIATNPVLSFPDQARLKEALRRLDFLVVQDGFHPTATTELADLVLPAAIWGEKEGSYTNSERRVSRVRTAVAPPGEAKTDFEIFLELAGYLGVRDRLFPGWQGPEDAFAEMRRVSAGRLCDYSGMSYALMEAQGGLQWPCNEDHPEGCDSLYADGIFPTEDGRANLMFTSAEKGPEEVDDFYPLLLNTGRTVEHWHTGTKTREVPILDKLAPEAWVELNPQTARRYAIGARDRVCLVSARGRVDGLLVRISETIGPDQVFVPFHFAEQCINKLTLPAFDPKSREPNYKQCAVRLERCRQPQP
ncbi:MAG: molybdopterin-dependent oxidoreductase [Candidatus Latescibacteria bacterium]|nr:molybdopterin-dependent oxidoreductase [Candidatus Latescibacterota bacterium]